MASHTFNIPVFQQGWFMEWSMFLQAAYTWTATLKDDAFVYVDNVSASGTDFVKLAQGSAIIQGNNLQLILSVTSNTLKFISPVQGVVSDTSGNTKGMLWSIVGEDGTDDDYNDILVQMTAWVSRG